MRYELTDRGVLEIAEHEGIVLGPYLDSVGVWTYGVGHTAAAGGLVPERMQKVNTKNWSQDKVREELKQILKVFDEDLGKYEERVNQAVKVPLEPHQFDALVSFDLNTGGIFRAKLTDSLNRGNYDKAAEQFMGWLRPKEIIKRRKAEMMLFKTGGYDANGSAITVWDTNVNGKLSWRGTISSKELEELMRSAKTKRKPKVFSFSSVFRFLRSVFN